MSKKKKHASKRSKRKVIKRKRRLKNYPKTPRVVPGGLHVIDNIPNTISEYESVEEEAQARQDAAEEQIKLFRNILPRLLKRLERIKDPRNPKKLTHKLTVLLLYGIFSFVYQMTSRRDANRSMSKPQFKENLNAAFPELESLPHNDTLNRVLSSIDVEEIEQTYIELIQRFIRKKKFVRYLVDNRYLIAIDGTRKLTRNECWAEECLEQTRTRKNKDGTTEEYKQFYVYVLEACLVFPGGMRIPLLSEFLTAQDGDVTRDKQDCELNAFKRLAKQLKQYFPRLPIRLLLDGLYPSGPVFELCQKYNWQFMIVLKDKSLSSVWEQAEELDAYNHQSTQQRWGDREQLFRWVNEIYYEYSKDNRRKMQVLHLVVCDEQWQEYDREGNELTKQSHHAWLSSETICKENVHSLCNLSARTRWAIENNILVEKHHGYQYEHLFSENWNAMKGYHYLMHIGHFLNVITRFSQRLAPLAKQKSVRNFIQFLRDSFAHPWLDKERLAALVPQTYQIRLI